MRVREAIGSALRGMFDKAAFAPIGSDLLKAIDNLNRVSDDILAEDDARARAADDTASSR